MRLLLALLLAPAALAADPLCSGSEPKDAACVLSWDAATPGGVSDTLAAYRVYDPAGVLCGTVSERRWTNRLGVAKRSDPVTRWNPYRSDSAECWPEPGESVTYCVRAVDSIDQQSPNCSNPVTVIGVAMQCCNSTGCATCSQEGR